MPSNKITFHHLDIKYTYGVLASFLGGVFVILAVLVTMAVNDLDEMLLPVMAVLAIGMIGLTAYFIIKAVKSGKQPPEAIEFSSTGFHSKQFGRVDISRVSSYRVTSGLSMVNVDKPAPSLHITLQTGKKIRYDLNVKYYDDEIDDYMAFVDQFVEAMAPDDAQTSSTVTSAERTIANNKNNDRQRAHQEATDGLEKAKKRKARKFFIPTSLGIALFLLVRSYGPEIVDSFKDHPLREMRQSTFRRYDNQVERLRKAMRKEGKVFMFTNDSTAKVRLYPNMQLGSDESTNFLLQKSETASNMAYFLEHADSLGYLPVVILPDYSLKQSARFPLPKGEHIKYLYFMVYDSQNRLNGYGSSNNETLFTWAVSYKNVHALKDSINNAFPSLKQFKQIFDKLPGFYLYVTAAESNGTSEAEFKQAAEVVKEMLLESKVDMSKFETEMFNNSK